MTNVEASGGRGGIQVIARAASILRALKNQRDGLSLGQIAQRVDLPRSTVQRIVAALESEHFVIAASPEGGIRLGPALQSLAEAARIDITEMTRPYLIELSKETGETVDLAVPRDDKLIFVDKIPGTQRLRAVSSIGEVFPLTTTANGKACLTLMDDSDVAILAKAEWKANGARRRDIDAFMTEIRKARQSGVAFDEDEHTDGISAVGVAFRDANGGIYAISVPTPTSRFIKNRARLTRAIKKTLAAINDALTPASRP
jgi:DNA-binding IclR family transcriptional regulator